VRASLFVIFTAVKTSFFSSLAKKGSSTDFEVVFGNLGKVGSSLFLDFYQGNN